MILQSGLCHTAPALWASQPYKFCRTPLETLSFRWLAGDSACRGGTPSMLALLLPHLDCIALPHCQPISTLKGSAHILPFATDIASCHSLLLEHAVHCVPRACCGAVSGRWEKERAAHQSHRHQPPLSSRSSYIIHMMLASQKYNILYAWAPLSW